MCSSSISRSIWLVELARAPEGALRPDEEESTLSEQRREDGQRPDPDELLRRVNAERERKERAKLKVFFGFAPGVGKTYAMLESAQRLKSQGVDVVVGAVETHGRQETLALCEN